MAKALTWKDLSEVQILQILQTQTPSQTRRKLQLALRLEDKQDELKAEILLDLHFSTFLFAKEQGFSIDKISALISIVKALHQHSTENDTMDLVQRILADGRFTVAKSWEYAKNLLMMHTVQRPPFSTTLFSLTDLQTITQYLLHTYFKHYKLYVYAFTPNYILNVETMKLDLHELARIAPSLKLAETEDEREAHMARLQRELEEVERKLKESERLAEEAAIAASIHAAYRASIGTEVQQAANEAVVRYLEQMRTDIEEKLLSTECLVLSKIKGGPPVEPPAKSSPRKEKKDKQGKEKEKEGAEKEKPKEGEEKEKKKKKKKIGEEGED